MNSLLQGGQMRRKRGGPGLRRHRRGPGGPRRPRRGGLGIALVALALIIGAAVWLFVGIGDSGRKGADLLQPPKLQPVPGSAKRARREGPPGIALIGGPTVDVSFKVPPRGGLLFDMKTGQVLWRRH